MNFIEELRWRNMLFDMTPGAEEQLAKGGNIGYIGFDPTAPSMTIGNFVQLQLLRLWQDTGNTPVVLMGGATGRIGDPSGKDAERQLKSYEELDYNLEHQAKQAKKLLNFEDGPNKAILLNNHDFYKEMNILTFLRDVGKTLTVSYMMSKDSVKNRLATGLSFTEFSYQLLQAYDFQYLYQNHGVRFQMGGSDQWGNITSGTEFIRRNLEDAKAYAVTTPLLTKSDGKKFGKSESGNIWLDPNMTSPYKFYQFWINADDADIPQFTRYFTLKTKEEVEALEKEYESDPNTLKKILAEELTKRVHSEEAYKVVLQVSEILFNKNASNEFLKQLNADTLDIIGGEIESYEVDMGLVQNQVNIVDILAEHCQIVKSKGEAKRAIKGNSVSVNKIKITDDTHHVKSEDLLEGKYLLIEVGKKNKNLIKTV